MRAGLGLVPPFKKGAATSCRVCDLRMCNISLYWLKPWEYFNSQIGKFSLEWEPRDQVTSHPLVLTYIRNFSLQPQSKQGLCDGASNDDLGKIHLKLFLNGKYLSGMLWKQGDVEQVQWGCSWEPRTEGDSCFAEPFLLDSRATPD